MKLQLIATALLASAALLGAQSGFAEESPLMQNRMVNLNQAALQHQAERTASQQHDATPAHQG